MAQCLRRYLLRAVFFFALLLVLDEDFLLGFFWMFFFMADLALTRFAGFVVRLLVDLRTNLTRAR